MRHGTSPRTHKQTPEAFDFLFFILVVCLNMARGDHSIVNFNVRRQGINAP